tara:strand:- start:149 stop:1519 length:1371 start_codon:yes stop_codon:yes gene_type:complete
MAINNTNTSILFTNSSGAGNLPAGRAGWITSSFSNYASGFYYSSTAAGFGANVVGFSIEFADVAAATAFLGVASLTGAGTFAAFATTVTVTQNDNATAQFAATHYARQAAVSGGVIIHFTQALNSTTAITPISGSGTQANVSSTNTIGGANTKVTTPVTGFNSTNSGMYSTEEGLKLPSGISSNQPSGAAAEQGMIRNNTSKNTGGSASAISHYNGTAWKYFAATESPIYPTSLKMYLDANNVSSNPGSGTVWTDLTGNGNNGALVSSTFQSGTPKYVNIPGTDGSATRVNLAGTGGTTQVTNLIGGTQPLTVQGYGYFSSSGSGYDYFFILGNGSSGSLISIAKYDGTNKLYIYDGSSVLLSNYTVSLNTWYNLAISVTGSTYKLYVNGVLQYTVTGNTKNITSNTAQIGSYSASATNFQNNLTGRVGEFRIYQAVLTGTEILANFNNTKATYGL